MSAELIKTFILEHGNIGKKRVESAYLLLVNYYNYFIWSAEGLRRGSHSLLFYLALKVRKDKRSIYS